MKTKHKHKSSLLQRGVFNSFKLKKAIPYETQIEHDYLHHLEFDRPVLGYQSIGSLLQKALRYEMSFIPCFFVSRKDRQEFVLLNPGNIDDAKLQIVKSRSEGICRNYGFGHRFLIRGDVPQNTYLSNIKLLYRNAATPFSSDDMFAAGMLLKNRYSQTATIDELADFVGNKDAIYGLLFHRALSTNLLEVLTDQTIVWEAPLFDYFLQSTMKVMPADLTVNL